MPSGRIAAAHRPAATFESGLRIPTTMRKNPATYHYRPVPLASLWDLWWLWRHPGRQPLADVILTTGILTATIIRLPATTPILLATAATWAALANLEHSRATRAVSEGTHLMIVATRQCEPGVATVTYLTPQGEFRTRFVRWHDGHAWLADGTGIIPREHA